MNKPHYVMLVSAAMLIALGSAAAFRSSAAPAVEIVRSYATEQRSDPPGHLNSSTNGHSTIFFLEQVLATTDVGTEFLYDLPLASNAADRAREWQLPARVLLRPDGSRLLLNRSELEARLGKWLKIAKWDRRVCGQWIFTWNAFKIECDPDSVLDMVRGFSLRSIKVGEGISYMDPEAKAPAPLRRSPDGSYSANLVVDPEKVRRDRAEQDVIVGKIMGSEVAGDEARARHQGEAITGTIVVTLVAQTDGSIIKRTRVVQKRVKKPDGITEIDTGTETTTIRTAVIAR